MKNKVILIYNAIPEEVRVYDLSVSDEQLAMLKLCHGRYINLVQKDEVEKALQEMLALVDEQESPIFDDADKLAQIHLTEPCHLIITGIFL